MRNKFLRNPLHIVKDYELRKLLWQFILLTLDREMPS